jgi:SAM-dependent methyltransferase
MRCADVIVSRKNNNCQTSNCQSNALPDGIDRTFSHASLLPLLYEDQSYGWSAGMRAVTHALLDDITLPDGAVVEVGFGGGQMLAELQRRYPERTTIGVELHPLALATARVHLPATIGLAQAALPDLPCGRRQVALLVALDVFDQRGVDLSAACVEAYRLLRPDGALVMRVSAHPSLYGSHDIAFHTGRRYTRAEVQNALAGSGFMVQRLSYANLALSLPVAAMRLAQHWGWLAFRAAIYQQPAFHQVAGWLLRQEAAWLHHTDLPWGLSLCAVARKP